MLKDKRFYADDYEFKHVRFFFTSFHLLFQTKKKFSRFVIQVCVTCLHMSFQFAQLLRLSGRVSVATQR
jgi:hypothetical protein